MPVPNVAIQAGVPVPDLLLQDDDDPDLSSSHCTEESEHTDKLNHGLKPAAKPDASRAAFGPKSTGRIFMD